MLALPHGYGWPPGGKVVPLMPRNVDPPADAFIHKDHGIYQETTLDGNSPNLRATVDAIRARAAANPTIRLPPLLELQALRDLARNVIRMAIIPDDADPLPAWVTIKADLGDGPDGYVCIADRRAGVEEAASQLVLIDAFLAGNPSEREVQNLLQGKSLGRLEEKENVLPFEPMVLREKKRAAGHRKTFGDDAADRKARAIELYHEVRPKHRNKTQAVDQVAKQLGFAKRKVWEYLKSVLP